MRLPAELAGRFAASNCCDGGGSSPSSESPPLIRGRLRKNLADFRRIIGKPEWKLVMGTFTVSQLFERELRRLIDVEIERLKENMSFGMVEDFDEYRFISGKIAGLRLAIEYMDEADSNIHGREAQ